MPGADFPASPESKSKSLTAHAYTMLSAALRVLARAAVIQRAEAAARTATAHSSPAGSLTALDRLIDAAPHHPPPPAPGTHPADKGHGIPLPLSVKGGYRGPVKYVQPGARPKPETVESVESVRPIETVKSSPLTAIPLTKPVGPAEPAEPVEPTRPAETVNAATVDVDADKPPAQPVPPIVKQLEAAAEAEAAEDDEVCRFYI